MAMRNHQGILTIGDAFIDYVSITKNNDKYNQKLGGATVNVAVHLSRFGVPSYYLTKLGIERDSIFVKNEMAKEGLNLYYSIESNTKMISKVFVHLDKDGERQFHSYENETPEEVILSEDLTEEAFDDKKIFYFGSGTLFHPKAQEATKKAITIAKEKGSLVAFDANIRLQRWKSAEECRKTILKFIPFVDVFKLSMEELTFLFQKTNFEENIEMLKEFEVPFKLITMGNLGALGIWREEEIYVPAQKVVVKDTNGAGDAFMATILFHLYKNGVPKNVREWRKYIAAANRLGEVVATKYGSLPILRNYSNIIP